MFDLSDLKSKTGLEIGKGDKNIMKRAGKEDNVSP